MTTSYCMDSRSLIRPLVARGSNASRRVGTHSTLCPANSLTAPSMAVRKEPWVGTGYDRLDSGRGAQRIGWWLEAGVDVAVQEEPRDWLDARRAAKPGRGRTAAVPNVVQPSHETLAELQRMAGEQRPAAARRRDRASASCRTVPRSAGDAARAMRPRSRIRRPASRSAATPGSLRRGCSPRSAFAADAGLCRVARPASTRPAHG